MEAIILCAGRGRRLGLNIPKCLLEINNETLLYNQIRMLSQFSDLKHIVVVGGFKVDEVYKEINKIQKEIQLQITLAYNTHYDDRSILQSLIIGNRLLKDDTIIQLDGDCYFTDNLIHSIPLCSTLFAKQQIIPNKYCPILNIHNKSIVNIELKNANINEIEWMCANIYVNNDFKKIMLNANRFIDKNFHFYDLLNFSLSQINLQYCITNNIYEIDTPEDLEHVKLLLSNS